MEIKFCVTDQNKEMQSLYVIVILYSVLIVKNIHSKLFKGLLEL